MISLSNSRTNGNTSCETHFCSYSSLTLKAGRILASLRMTQVIERPFVFCRNRTPIGQPRIHIQVRRL
ncbi:hypothetical protein BDQ12DRAFT_308169 [Crucibulum laeve]|uniref:Uncharacterized protein n=1 Tax=Crucibulum laeve TaxID=68775 RepID=A0A5C3LQY5_9AGAR|nr:hypothetical protein BDQ12DRAFT_308169 [Crucibulum laeve]